MVWIFICIFGLRSNSFIVWVAQPFLIGGHYRQTSFVQWANEVTLGRTTSKRWYTATSRHRCCTTGPSVQPKPLENGLKARINHMVENYDYVYLRIQFPLAWFLHYIILWIVCGIILVLYQNKSIFPIGIITDVTLINFVKPMIFSIITVYIIWFDT
jgi:hypothetical protein